jgi:hypothetical protein
MEQWVVLVQLKELNIGLKIYIIFACLTLKLYFFFNQFGGDQLVADLLDEINNLKNNKRAISLSQNKNKINFTTHFLATGCKLNTGIRLWRVTTNYDTVDTLIINSVQYTVSTTPGIWFTSGTNSTSFEQTSYDSDTKTLTLTKLV